MGWKRASHARLSPVVVPAAVNIQDKVEDYADEIFHKLEKVAKSKDLDYKEFNKNLKMCCSEDGGEGMVLFY